MKNHIINVTKFVFLACVIYALGVSNAKKSCKISSKEQVKTECGTGNPLSVSVTSVEKATKNKDYALTNKPEAVTVKKTEVVQKWSPNASITMSQKAFIKRFAKTAKEEQKRYDIPASITLAQGLLESGNGKGWLAKNANNYFGVKCFSKKCKRGHCVNREDDDHKDFFRKYKSAWESFRMHSKFLQGERYKPLYQNSIGDYRGWAYGLKKAGYATDKRYAEKLIKLIEDLNLNYFDIVAK